MSPAIARRAPLLAQALFTILVTLVSGILIARAANLVTPNDMTSGALLLKSGQDGQYIEAPRVATDVDVTVSGPTARTRITQRFLNPAAGWVEGVYVFPLPDESAVDTLKMIAGERVIVGEVKEKREAKIVYEEAMAQGRKAALLEQERPNLFTNSVANIGPGEQVIVQIEYQETIRQSDGVYSLRVPLVVAPRYNPPPPVRTVDFSANGHAAIADPVPDRDRISPPVLDPRKAGPVNPTTITVRLNAGFPLGEVKSHHHAIVAKPVSDTAQVITLGDDPVPANKDFELTWAGKANKSPAVGLFTETLKGETYLLGFVTPPAIEASQDRRPREMVLVIDNSGSMGGPSMEQAKRSLLFALGRLTPQDKFNVIRFDDTMDTLFADTVPATPENVAQAQAFVSRLEAAGGTEMVPPLRAALNDPRPNDGAYLRQLVFLTDGAIGNEQDLFNLIASRRGRSRIFMVGIGSAPNTFLMTRASEVGRGTFTHIGEASLVQERMRELFAKLESPVVTELRSDLAASGADMSPDALPDLYRGEPVVFVARTKSPPARIRLAGKIGDTPWSVTVPVAGAAPGSGLSKLWARRKIGSAEVAATLGELTPEASDKRILALALEHQLVSRLTSLVAVDKTPSRPAGQRLLRADVPLNLPEGWDYDKVFGEQQPVPALEKDAAAEFKLIKVAANPLAARNPNDPVVLPQTATPAELLMSIGGLLMSLSLLLLALLRRAERA